MDFAADQSDSVLVPGKTRPADGVLEEAMDLRRWLTLGTSGVLAYSLLVPQALGAGNFVQTYIDAQGGCGSGDALAFVLTGGGHRSPFGKPGADWTDEDLASLKRVLAACVDAAAARNNPYSLQEVRGDVERVLKDVPQVVREARAEREAEARQLEARKSIAQGRLEKAERDRKEARASAEAEIAKLEQQAQFAEAEARNAVMAANRQIQEASRRAAEAKAGVAESLATLQAAPRKADPNQAAPSGELQELPDDFVSTRTKTEYVACLRAEHLVEASKDILAKDFARVGAFVRNGQCFVVAPGTAVRVRRGESKSGQAAVCVGIDPHEDCLWVPGSILEAAN